MKESNPESKKIPEVSDLIDSDKINTPKKDFIVEKPHKKNNKSKKKAIEEQKPLLNEVDDQKTRIMKRASLSQLSPSKKNLSNENPKEQNSTHSSSLLKDLHKWDKSRQTSNLKSGQIIRGTYRLDSKIGSGGMGEVWKAIDLIQDAGEAKDKYVAIKFTSHEIRNHPHALKALVREFGRYKKLIHPNIMKAYELNRDDNDLFIVMEYLEGCTLKEFIKQHPKGLSLEQAQPIIKGMCDALEYAHNEGIVHLDFKPANVYYNESTRTPKVIDFGIARLSSSKERDKTRFDPGTLGAITTAYASNEMLMEADPDPRDDIYSLACIVYELLSGKHPFNKKLSIKAEREKMRPSQISGLDHNDFQALLNGLNFYRDSRTTSAAQFYSELYLPNKTLNQQRKKWPILAAAALIIPIVIYKGYTSWQIDKVRVNFQQQSDSTLENFMGLTINGQEELLNKPSFRLALVKYANNNKKTDGDVLQQIDQFDPKIHHLLFSDEEVKTYLLSLYRNKINSAIKDDDFQLANQKFLSILNHYPDSTQLIEQFDTIVSQKEKRLVILKQNYQQCLKDDSKKLTELFPCLQKTRKNLNKFESANDFLASRDLTKRYIKEVSSAISSDDLSSAKILIENWHLLEKNKIDQRTQLEKLIKVAHAKKIIPNTPALKDSQKTIVSPEKEVFKVLATTKIPIQNPPASKKLQKNISQASPEQEKPENLKQQLAKLFVRAEQQYAKKQLLTPLAKSAWQTYQEILIWDPKNKKAQAGINKIAKAYVYWAKRKIKRKNYPQARELFNKALKVAPNNKAALSGIAKLKKKKYPTRYILQAKEKIEKGDFERARYFFNKALEISPNNQAAKSGLSWLDRLDE
jgi:serine/threonine protein kinase